MKRKIASLTLSALLFLSVFALPPPRASAATTSTDSIAVIQVGSPNAFVNERKTQIDTTNKRVAPIKKNGRTLLPLRFCAVAMNGTARYISDNDYITVTVGLQIARFKINSKKLEIVDKNGKVLKTISMDVAAVKLNGRVLVPARAISEGLGCSVFYKKIRTDELVVISKKKLSLKQREFQMALLLNLKKYVYTHTQKTFQITLSKAWILDYDGCSHEPQWNELINPLYPYYNITLVPFYTKADRSIMNYTKAQVKNLIGSTYSLVSYKKTKINGNNALIYSYKVKDTSEGQGSFYVCLVASKNAGARMEAYLKDNSGYNKEIADIFNTCKLLK